MNLEQLSAALEEIRANASLPPQTSVLVRMHPSLMFNLSESSAAIRGVEVETDRDGSKYIVVFISNSVVR